MPECKERLNALRRYAILDTPPEGAFDRITALAADMLDVPVAVVSIVDTDRVWMKSVFGPLAQRELARLPSLCARCPISGLSTRSTRAFASP